MKFVIALVLSGCAAYPPPALPSQSAFAGSLEEQTLLLEGDDHLCTGTWIGPKAIITAAHCIDVGSPISFYSRGDKAKHTATLSRVDLFKDLALYIADTDPKPHRYATIGTILPLPGDNLYFYGHPSGLTWSFRRGYASYASRDIDNEDDFTGPYLQVSAPLFPGDSGGAVYSEQGELVGIVHAVATRMPSVGFAVPLTTIRDFLK